MINMICKVHNGISLKALDPLKTAEEVGTLGIVVIKNSKATPKDFADWSLDFGYHLSPEIWCTDKEISNVFWRVTNQTIDGLNQGLVGDHELNWHCNTTPVLDGEEVVGLYGRTITYNTETWFCNSIPYWSQLDKETKERYKKLTVVLDPKRRLGRIQPGWTPNWNSIYSKEIIDDIGKNRETREIANCKNMSRENQTKYKKSRGIWEKAKFVPNHPLGTEGLFFTPYEVHGFLEDEKLCEDSHLIYWRLWKDWIQSEKYTYKHVWEPGDIILMDQTVTIHKRPDILKDKPRELLRIACWYKTESRLHFDYVL